MGNPLGARKNGKFRAVSTAPSFNKTPMGSSTPPVPYPVYHDLANSTGTVSKVNFNGDPVYVLNQTTQSKCVGDNPGTAKGVKSGTVNGEIKPTSSSSSVNVGKKPLVRERDKCTLNSGNCPGVYVTEPAPAAPSAPKKKKSSSLNIHDVLDVFGFIPGLGAIPDLANAGIYAVHGNFAMAGLSVVAAVPGYGDAVKGGSMMAKGGKKLVKSVEKKALKEAEEKTTQKVATKKEGSARVEKKPRKPIKPDEKKWKEKGGKVEKNRDGSVTYTNKDGKYVTYNKDGYPDFKPHSQGEVQIDMKGNRTSDFTNADKAYRDKVGDPNWSKPTGNNGSTWHHCEDGKTMQLVPTKTHSEFSHTGGVSTFNH